MTQEEFDKTCWTANMKVEYKGFVYGIGAANFPERLIGLYDGSDQYIWVRCENIKLVPKIDDLIVSEAYYVFLGTTVTICLLKLLNGLTVTGESTCDSPENVNAEIKKS